MRAWLGQLIHLGELTWRLRQKEGDQRQFNRQMDPHVFAYRHRMAARMAVHIKRRRMAEAIFRQAAEADRIRART